ncbi:MAG: site-2 protease family protein [Caulobacteraceae bacterium]
MLHFAHNALVYTAPFLFVLTLVVTVHEFGHFLVARLCGVAVDRFSIGFGRALASWRDRSGIEWRIGWIPLGGYVKFAGDDNVASVPDEQDLADLKQQIVAREGAAELRRYFHFKPLWQRALVVAAGPVANFLLAITIFAALALAAGEVTVVKPRIGAVAANSPAAAAGFQAGDLITKADGRSIDDFGDLQRFVLMRAGEPIRFQVDRNGAPVQLVATPMRRQLPGQTQAGGMTFGYLGLAASQAPGDLRTFRFGPLGALRQGVRQTGDILGSTLTYLRRIASGYESGDQLSGRSASPAPRAMSPWRPPRTRRTWRPACCVRSWP